MGKFLGYRRPLNYGGAYGGASVCVRCPKAHPIDSPSSNRAVLMSFVFQDESLCPEHALEAIHEAGLTLDEAIGSS